MTITLSSDNIMKLETLATQYDVDANELFEQALKSYRRRLEETKIEQEKQAFLGQHEELKKQYLGRFIAMHQGDVVDTDVDMVTLHQRIRQKYGRTAILLRRVEEVADCPLMIRNPRFQWNRQ